MRLITVCMPYHNNPGMLARHASEWRGLRQDVRDRIAVSICDDASDVNIARASWTTGDDAFDKACRLSRVLPPHVRWSQCVAQNLAVALSSTEWVLLTDIDHIVPAKTWDGLLTALPSLNANDAKKVYCFERENVDGTKYKPHPNSWLMTRDMWERAKGHDERYRGYYHQDAAWVDRLRHASKNIGFVRLPFPLVRYGRETIPDASSPPAMRDPQRDQDARTTAAMRAKFRADGTFFDDTRQSAKWEIVW